jgi:ATPase subunit of ABC transporter with duplicated ATPase domains
MPSLRLHHVSYAYGGGAPVLRDLSLHLRPGFTGVVGANGSGKTTLLRLLGGELAVTHGQVVRDPADAPVALCPQRVDEPTASIRALAGAWDRGALRWMRRMALDPVDLDRWSTLSPGERKRWQLAAALSTEPDILLLDEPTNHVDAEGRRLLVAALERFTGIGVLVSHDRVLLDELPRSIVCLEDGRAVVYEGGYQAARDAREAARAGAIEAHDAARRARRLAHRKLADERRRRAAAEAQTSVRARARGPRDSDARSVGTKTLVAWAEARIGRGVHVARARAERADRALAEQQVTRSHGGALFAGYAPCPRRWLIRTALPEQRAGDRPLWGPFEAAVARDGRVHLAGPNGAGKTSLLAALLARAALPADRVVHLPQELSESACAAAAAEVREMDASARGRLLEIVSALGVEPERVLATPLPSPGEARKLLLARGLARNAWLAVLDEPTNHLDLPSIERLEAALAEYPGALILVTHDEPLASRLTNTVWRFEGGAVRIGHR